MQTDDKNLIELYQDYIDDEGYVQRYNYDKGRYYNTGTCLKGPKGNPGNPGRPGKDGLTPRINQDNGHWMIGDVDTGITAGGTVGQLKTINGQSIVGEGNISTATPFDPNWDTSSVLTLCQSMYNNVNVGECYLGELRCGYDSGSINNKLPVGIANAEVKVEVLGNESLKILFLTVTSTNVSPYHFERSYISGTLTPWRSYALNETVVALQNLIESDNNGVIDKFNEIISFLNNISSNDSLEGLLSNITLQLADKSDKVTNVSNNGNFAGLNSSGNLTDSGYSASDFIQSQSVNNVVVLTQDQFDALNSYDENTEYNII